MVKGQIRTYNLRRYRFRKLCPHLILEIIVYSKNKIFACGSHDWKPGMPLSLQLLHRF